MTTNTYLVIGASSGIAKAVIAELIAQHTAQQLPANIICISRGKLDIAVVDNQLITLQSITCDYHPASIDSVCQQLQHFRGAIVRVFICNGVLHKNAAEQPDANLNQPQHHNIAPEKRIEDIDAEALKWLFEANSITPMMWLKYLTPLLSSNANAEKCVVSVLSAKVGSISDNQLGGWYGYRASKAALNMLIKTTAIEYARRLKHVKLIAFHPGTTDTPLSQPFQANVPKGKLFTPEFVAKQLITIADQSDVDGAASFVDWAGKSITW
ncbi:SDR family NAD(P)-dependent oxidoreductase [Shewanella sp. ULN5]|uniref:SDR family NAD(P)-dependent oxidoreductase n=1 Tax=Shewanella sp. ULN5 TaxID=2994678 RepID=UPI00273E81CF|nr:SDR family NAD(P)-dependent oxidoreductase [Shewanella sp. ULN5]MDP5145703.1 SDR family NAD(P)-dependent oxidoreductase [Shewanella sp. ULN5]